MNTVYDSVMDQLGGSNMTQLSQQLGADEATTHTAVQTALPMLLAGLARNSAEPQGAAALSTALEDHRGGVLGGLGGLLGNAQSGPGGAILGHIFGSRRTPVEAGVSKATGLDPAQIGKLLMVLAPIVMSVLAQKRAQVPGASMPGTPAPGGAPGGYQEAGDLGPMLDNEAREATRRAPGGLGGLIGILDRDGDGNPLNDLGKLGGMLGR